MSSRLRTALTAPLAVAALGVTATVVSLPTAAPASGATTTSSPTPYLPFDMPATTALRSTPQQVFAHYWPPLPISLDNKDASVDYYTRNYLTPTGENGKHAAYGGHLRDRPIPRPVRTESTWRLTDMQGEVRSAIAAGLDGFAVCIMQLAGDPDVQVWNNTNLIFQAAQAVDPKFKMILMPDMSGTMANKSADVLAQYMDQLGDYPNAYHLSDGRLVISPFQAESKSVDFWTQFLSIMKSRYGVNVAFMPVFQDEQKWAPSFAPISWAMSHWGARNPAWNDPNATYSTSRLGRVAKIHALGKPWMQPVSIQDERPNQGIYDEALNTQNLRDTWQIARNSDSEMVQLVTWNDYTENTHFSPSRDGGNLWLDLNAYYLTWYKTGQQPTIERDTIYLTHRLHKVAAVTSYPETKLQVLRGGSPARDMVEALVFTKDPSTVVVTVGGVDTTCSVPAGVTSCLAPLRAGTVSAKIVRSGQPVEAVTSPTTVTDTPYVQDLQYIGATSGRTGTHYTPVTPTPTPTTTSATPTTTTPTTTSPTTTSTTTTTTTTTTKTTTTSTAPTTTTTTTTTTASPTPTPVTLEVTASADSYANQGAPSTTFGSETSLLSRGNLGSVSYLRFTLPAAPTGKTLTSAVLRLRTTTDSIAGSKETHTITTASDAWAEDTVTWNTKPALGTTTLGTIAAGAVPDAEYATTLNTSAVAALLGKQSSIAITNAGTDSLWFWSSEAAGTGNRPQLELSFR